VLSNVNRVLLQAACLFLAGLLAGTKLIVRYGVQPALRRLPDGPHVLARQALVRRLRVAVPILIGPTVLSAIAVLVTAGGSAFRWAGVGWLAVFLLTAALGTVSLNIRISDWDPERPPADWKAVITRWERLDVLRSTAAIACFAAAAVQL
jgi:hypothetical protein